jgi:hypothetical protein
MFDGPNSQRDCKNAKRGAGGPQGVVPGRTASDIEAEPQQMREPDDAEDE